MISFNILKLTETQCGGIVLDPLRVNCVREEGKGDPRMALNFNIT